MAGAIRKSRVKEVPLSEIKDDLSRFLREAETQEIGELHVDRVPNEDDKSYRRRSALYDRLFRRHG